MDSFKLKQNSLEVVQTIIENNKEIVSINLISHKVEINWRQLYKNEDDKIQHLEYAFNHTKPLKQEVYTREKFLSLTLDKLEKLANDEVWSVCSRVKCENGEYKHMSMMNFHPENISVGTIIESLKYILPNSKGAILESGRFFHYYGLTLLSEDEWKKLLAQFLMPCILVSPRYIGHRLYDGYCSLRLTTDIKYKTKIPKVVIIV